MKHTAGGPDPDREGLRKSAHEDRLKRKTGCLAFIRKLLLGHRA